MPRNYPTGLNFSTLGFYCKYTGANKSLGGFGDVVSGDEIFVPSEDWGGTDQTDLTVQGFGPRNYEDKNGTPPERGGSPVIEEATTARTLSTSDSGNYIRLTNASACTLTVPTDAVGGWAALSFPAVIYFRVAAAGIPVLSSAGVTVNDAAGIVAGLAADSNFALKHVGANEWDVI